MSAGSSGAPAHSAIAVCPLLTCVRCAFNVLRLSGCWTIIIPFLVMIVFLATTKALDDINVPDTGINLSQYNQPNLVDFSSAQPQLLQTVSGNGEQVQLVDLTATVGSNATAFALYLYQSAYSLQLSRYGALMYNASIGGPTLQDSATILFNTSGIYALPAFFNLYNTALLRAITGSPTATISMSFWGFPETVSAAQRSRHNAPVASPSPPRLLLTRRPVLCCFLLCSGEHPDPVQLADCDHHRHRLRLHPGQLRVLRSEGERGQEQAPAAHQRRAALGLLGGQLHI